MTSAPSRRAAAPSIDIQVQSPLWQAEPAAEQTVRDAIAAAAATLSTAAGEVAYRADRRCGDSRAQSAMARHRQTDQCAVVSGGDNGGRPAPCSSAISSSPMRRSTRECDDEDRVFLHHLAHLTVHGFLHLIGYDHQVDAEADEMEGLESKIMARMKLPDPYLGARSRRRFA